MNGDKITYISQERFNKLFDPFLFTVRRQFLENRDRACLSVRLGNSNGYVAFSDNEIHTITILIEEGEHTFLVDGDEVKPKILNPGYLIGGYVIQKDWEKQGSYHYNITSNYVNKENKNVTFEFNTHPLETIEYSTLNDVLLYIINNQLIQYTRRSRDNAFMLKVNKEFKKQIKLFLNKIVIQGSPDLDFEFYGNHYKVEDIEDYDIWNGINGYAAVKVNDKFLEIKQR